MPLETQIMWSKQKEIQNTCFITNDVMATGSGTSIIFTDINTSKETHYRADGETYGDGVSCLAGHKNLQIFAFSEMCVLPRIFVLSYPHFNKIAELKHEKSKSYIRLEFSETEHLFALSGMPEYYLEIWCWRSGRLLAVQKSGINVDDQLLQCSPLSPLTICQLSINTVQMTIWEVHGSLDLCKLIERKIKLPFTNDDAPFQFIFNIDGSINMIVENGDVYQLSPTSGTSKKIIDWTGNWGAKMTSIAVYNGGLVLSGPDGSLRYFKKHGQYWMEQSYLIPEATLKSLKSLPYKDILIGITVDGNYIKYFPDRENNEIEIIKEIDRSFKLFVFLQPLCRFMITINVFSVMNVLEIKTSNRLASLKLRKITYLKEHPLLPIVVIGNGEGDIFFISLINPENPLILSELHLSLNCIEQMVFSTTGDYLVVCDSSGGFFIIRIKLGNEIIIMQHIQTNESLIDFVVTETEQFLSVLAIIKNNELKSCGKTGIRIEIPLNELKKEIKMMSVKFPELYMEITLYPGNLNQFLAVPYLSKEIHILELHSTEDDQERNFFEIIDSIKTFHQLNQFQFFVDKDSIITWGIDGLVTILDIETKENLFLFTAHHRNTGGVELARIDPFRKYVVTLGHSGNLFCTNIIKNKINQIQLNLLKEPLEFNTIKTMLNKEIVGFIPDGDNEGKKWIEIEKELADEKEKTKYRKDREKILKDFEILKEKIQSLLEKNDEAEDDVKLPIRTFNLDKKMADSLIESGRKERNLEEKNMENFIISKNKVTNCIKSICWETISVKGATIRGIFTKLNVENYSLLHPDPILTENLNRLMISRGLEYLVSKSDVFLPWKPKSTSQLEVILSHPPDWKEPLSFVSNVSSEYRTDLNTKFSLSGTSSHQFIEPLSIRYRQMEVVSFQQMEDEKIMSYHDNLHLREFFNKKFNELSAEKEIEMNSVNKTNDRLRHIQNELNILEKLKQSTKVHNKEIINPFYYPDEKPETIVIVEDWEVPVKPYISDSKLQLREDEFEETERKRLELLADDFCDRALITMMDGVLEIRWEDEIKKNPSIPEYLTSGKDPKDFDEDDLKAGKDYEDKIKFLQTERERYRKILEDEEIKLEHMLADQILKLNYKVGETLLLKMKVEAAISQEDLKQLRYSLYNFKRVKFNRKEQSIKTDMKTIKQTINSLNTTLQDLEKKVIDCRTDYDILMQKDRQLDKQFKSNFVETAPRSVVDQTYKIFKRRPKWIMRAWTTPAILMELGRRIIARDSSDKGQPLPIECFDFLKLIDQLDGYSHAPNGVDENLWQILCKMRRVKIESEFKVKSCGIQLAEAEATANCFLKEINGRNLILGGLDKKLEDLREKRTKELMNRSVQIVMKRGFVEIPLSGKISDFDNSILLHVTDVHDINKIIKNAGMKKLKTMENAAIFRRKIIYQEWEHNVLRMTVRDMKDSIKMIEKCKITKEVQMWLKRKQMGWSEDISQTALKREIDNAVLTCEKLLEEDVKLVVEIDDKIVHKCKENKMLDKKIQNMNVNVTEQQLVRDFAFEERTERERIERMNTVVERARLVRKVQQQHAQILELSTMLELQRLRTFPTLNIQPNLKKGFY